MTSAPQEKSTGIIIFGWLIIVSSLLQMHKLLIDKNWYFETYSYMPLWLVYCRYAFSWFQRIAGITAAVGALFCKEWGRKLLVLIGAFTIITVYWKHPLVGFKNHALYLDRVMPSLTQEFTFESLAFYSMITHIILDILFQSTLIYYFTRRHVKQQFS